MPACAGALGLQAPRAPRACTCEAAVSPWEDLADGLRLRPFAGAERGVAPEDDEPRGAAVTPDLEEDGHDDDRDGAV
jgi:hypothetical protein